MAKKFTFYGNIDGSNSTPVLRKNVGIANSQTLLEGDLVFLASGLLTKAASTLSTVFGVMAEDAVTADGTADVWIITTTQLWRTTASAAATSHILVAATYDIVDTTQLVNVADTTGGSIQIWDTLDSTTDIAVRFTVSQAN